MALFLARFAVLFKHTDKRAIKKKKIGNAIERNIPSGGIFDTKHIVCLLAVSVFVHVCVFYAVYLFTYLNPEFNAALHVYCVPNSSYARSTKKTKTCISNLQAAIFTFTC